uniref:Uncharacterized protein n=1 Tax=Anguilla anguilla TaxID=7936 RepID=A0A0E9RC31_ANGAN
MPYHSGGSFLQIVMSVMCCIMPFQLQNDDF